MVSPNGDHRLAKAISFLINRINSALFKCNGSNKNMKCEYDITTVEVYELLFLKTESLWKVD